MINFYVWSYIENQVWRFIKGSDVFCSKIKWPYKWPLIYNKPFFDQPVKNKQEAYEKPGEMSGNDDFTTGNS